MTLSSFVYFIFQVSQELLLIQLMQWQMDILGHFSNFFFSAHCPLLASIQRINSCSLIKIRLPQRRMTLLNPLVAA